LARLQEADLIYADIEEADGRRIKYRLSEKGIDLAPVMLELLIWGARHENTGAPCAVIDHLEKNRHQVLTEVRRRWLESDATPLLPSFADKARKRARATKKRLRT